ncbi:MAG: carbon starvation protein A [Firmicutes bacterium]|nr:carbon starvation protein A [Bacillota bacterium]
MASLVIVVGAVIFLIASGTYAKRIEKAWGIDGDRPTPAHTLEDGVDYVPAPKMVLFGHHFASIAGAAPVVGAIGASQFGWLPVAIWCVVAGVFIGGVQDFGALFASVRHGGRSIGDVIREYVGTSGKRLFCIFAWFTTILLAAAFFDIVANTFVTAPAAGTASLLFIFWAILYGLATNKLGLNRNVCTVIGVILTFGSVWLGIQFPLVLSHTVWIWILVVYVLIAAIAPVWILLQPRDFLNSFLLYAMMIGAVIGIVIAHPSIQMPAFTGFYVNNTPLFPILFVTLACGAVSGFHSLVGSGTTSKQVDNEKDMRMIGYTGMCLECFLALVALVTVMWLPSDIRAEVTANGALYVFAYGLGNFLQVIGVPFQIGQTFGTLALSAFAMTTLDTAMRLARYICQEFAAGDKPVEEARKTVKNPLVQPWPANLLGLVVATVLAFFGYGKIWSIFGSANQLLSAIALMGIILFLKSIGRKYNMCRIPMIWMMCVAICALAWNLYINIGKNWALVIIAALLLVVAIILFIRGFTSMSKKPEVEAASDK